MRFRAILLLGLCFITTSSWAGGMLPSCPDDRGGSLSLDDQDVLNWKRTTPNEYTARAHVEGTLSALYPDEHGHNHFEITIGPNPGDTLEVVYNISFGKLPALTIGMTVEACGDYITSDAATSQYPASPDDAIIHWIHRNPENHGHPSGFLAIDGQLYGQGNGSGD